VVSAVLRSRLLQAEAFGHEALEAGFVEKVVGEFLVGEHGEGGALGAGGEFRSLFDSEAGILADDGGDHAHHDLEAANSTGFVLGVLSLVNCERFIFFMFCRFASVHAAPFSRPTTLPSTDLDVATQRGVAPLSSIVRQSGAKENGPKVLVRKTECA